MISGDQYGILSRLILNEPLDPSPEGILRLLGFVHVYSASGLHLLALEAFLTRFFGKTLLSKKILTVCFWIFLLLIWKVQGFRLGFTRVLFIFFLKAWARLKGYRWRIYYPLFLAWCLDFALGIDAGWQHYYLAILGGMLGMELARQRKPWIQHLYLSVASWLMTAPLDLFHHHTISWMTPLWSMITIPIISLFLYPISLFSYLYWGEFPQILCRIWEFWIGWLLKIVDHGFTFSILEGSSFLFYGTLVIAVLIATLIKKMPRTRDRVVLGVFTILSALTIRFYSTVPFEGSHQRIVQLNVGQGDSLLIQGSRRVEMIDLGTSRQLKPETVILRLGRYGLSKVDTVLFSHLDEDHAGAVRLLLPWVKVGNLEVSSKFERTLRLRNWLNLFPETRWCDEGCMKLAHVDWILSAKANHRRKSPRKKDSELAGVSGNDLMGTAWIPLSDHEVYLALGDSDSEQETVFWTRHRGELRSYPIRWLKVSHHGSRFSSGPEFLNQVNPRQAVVSVGARNSYRHPHFSVLHELRRQSVPLHRTDRDGDFILERGE